MPNKSILFFIPCNPYFPSGIVRVEQYLSYFAQDGFKYEILNMIHPRSQILLEILDQSYFGKYKATDFVFRAAIHLLFTPYKYWQIFRLLMKARNFDYIFIQANLIPSLAVDLLQRINPRIIFDFDDAVFLRNRGRAIKIVTKAWKVFAGSHFNLEFANQYNFHSVLIPSAIDLSNYTSRIKLPDLSKKIVIGWIGGASTLKYLYHLVDPLQNLSQKGYEFTLLIAGTHGKDKLIPLFKNVELKVVQEYNHAEIAHLVEKIDIGVMPLDDGPWEKGKCGLKLLIYMAAGKPSVASPIGENVYIIEDRLNGFLVKSPAEWERRLEELLQDPALYKHIASQGLKTVQEKYSTEYVYQLIRVEFD